MTEYNSSSQISRVKDVITNKGWYGYNDQNGGFNWPKSVGAIAGALSLDPIKVEEAITSAYTPMCLSQVELEGENGETSSISLLKALQNKGVSPHIWTVGDLSWQEKKFNRSGAEHYVDKSHYHCSSSDKLKDLEVIIDAQVNSQDKPVKKRFIVVDDKEANIRDIKGLVSQYLERGVSLGNYHMKLNEPQADATAFYKWFLLQLKSAQDENEELVLILDFDGVVANTDAVLFGPAVENLAKLLNQ